MLSLKARRAIIRRRIKYGWQVTKICSHFNINRDTFYYHWNNYLLHGLEDLEIGSRKPNTVYGTPKEIADRIMEPRRSTNRSGYA